MKREESISTEDYRRQFNFREEGGFLVGIEREFHLADMKGRIVPNAQQAIEELDDVNRFGYELSACQLESRTVPCKLESIKSELLKNELLMERMEKELDLKRLSFEAGPDNMPLDIYPDPTGRYQEITKDMPQQVLLAACQIIGTHVHIGMPDYKTALLVYNKVIDNFNKLCKLGDGSSGKRLEIYKIMASDCTPKRYDDWNHFYSAAIVRNFAVDPRKCWDLIRISVHGTIEFRMFGTTDDLDKIVGWAEECHRMCENALQ